MKGQIMMEKNSFPLTSGSDIHDQYNRMINNRPYVASTYDTKVQYTLPYVSEFYQQTADLIRQYGNTQGKLLDIGFGTGRLEIVLSECFPDLKLNGIEISEDMIRYAWEQNIPNATFEKGSSLEMQYENAYDIVTSLMSHHYYSPEQRRRAVSNVYHSLKEGGLFICFENVRPADDFMLSRELDRWEHFQITRGKPEKEAAEHKQRCGTYYFPITVEEHIALLKEMGFRHVYVFWRSHMQMGIMGIR